MAFFHFLLHELANHGKISMGSTDTATGQKAKKGESHATKWIQRESRGRCSRLRAKLLRRPTGGSSLRKTRKLRGGNQVRDRADQKSPHKAPHRRRGNPRRTMRTSSPKR